MDIKFPPRLNLAQTPTPLQPLNRLSTELGGPRIWMKRDDLTGSHLSGNKIRKLEFSIARALQEGCDTLITCGGLQSNHCRTTALLGAQLGLKVQLILRGEPEGVADGNFLLDNLAGADIACYPDQQYSRELPALFEHWKAEHSKQGRKTFAIPTGASDGTGIWGYIACCKELQQDFNTHGIAPEYIVSATGSGGTQAGLTAGNYLFNLNVKVLGMAVCDNEDYFQRKVKKDLTAWQSLYGMEIDLSRLDILVNDQYRGPAYAVATQEIYDTIKQLAQLEGVVLDPVYTGKAFYGLMEEIRKGSFAEVNDIVFIHTGGIFGVFPHRHHFV